MMNRILSFAAASATAFSLAFTPAPAAAADAEDIAAAVAGIAVLGLIAKAVKDKDDERKAQSRAVSRHSNTHYTTHRHSQRNQFGNGRIIEGEIINGRGFANERGLRKIKRVTLPRRCVRQLRTRHGVRPVYGERCLEKRFSFASSLPQHCERLVSTRNGIRTFYSRRCLARDGWNVSLN